MRDLDFRVFDGDSHYYEAIDAFTRYVPKKMQSRCVQWAEIDGRRRLLVGGRINNLIPNPTFDPVAKPGCLWAYFKGENPEGLDMRALFGELEPIRPEYRDRDIRLNYLDQQGVDKTLLFPTLGVLLEDSLDRDREACVTAFHAFNRWIADDWGFAYKDRIYSAVYLTLVDVDAAVREVEWAIEHGARVINVRAAPARTASGTISPADRIFDRVWARIEEAGLLVTTHIGVSPSVFHARWEHTEIGGFRPQPLRWVLTHDRDVSDFVAVIIAHRLFDRFPRLRLMTVEFGAGWVAPLKKLLKKSHAQNPDYFAEDPLATFDRHIWVTPFWEDPIGEVLATVPTERITFGSDWPHAEGTVEPTDYAYTVEGLEEATQKRILRDNALEAVGLTVG
jgi:predicted TIM-barrel fold metal-dependent hydrolase